MSDLYTTKTAALKAIKADVRNLDAKKINLKGKDILEHIKESVPTIKHANDTRETVTKNDLWGQWVETKSDGTIIVHDDWVTNPNSSSAWNPSIVKVEDNKAYNGNKDNYGNLSNLALYANVQTNKIKDGTEMFNHCSNLTEFSSDLSSLTNGNHMFYSCDNLKTFSSDLSSLTNGYYMFHYCYNFLAFSSDLSSLTEGESMFANCSQLTSFSSELPSLTNGNGMFANCSQLTSFSSDLPSLTNGRGMLRDCSQLNSFSTVLSNLMDGYQMFNYCTNLKSFSSDLSSLTNGDDMFNSCYNLKSFSSDLSSLTYGHQMFYLCKNLTSFSSDSNDSSVNLSNLVKSISMFAYTNLSSFSSDLPNLREGNYMFANCTNLTSFTSDLPNLTDGSFMFDKCKIDAESVMYIANTIKDITTEKQLYTSGSIPYVTLSNGVYSASKGFMRDGTYVFTYKNPQPIISTIHYSNVGRLTLGINVSNNSSTIKQQLEDFAKAATFESWDILKTYFSKKGWTVTFKYGGTTDTIPDTYGLRGGERIIPCPIFAKLVQVEDKDSAHYCTEDASTFYNIDWGHDVTNPQDFQQFDSLEDAMRTFNVFPKENIIVTEE